jgi:hypothetical protein
MTHSFIAVSDVRQGKTGTNIKIAGVSAPKTYAGWLAHIANISRTLRQLCYRCAVRLAWRARNTLRWCCDTRRQRTGSSIKHTARRSNVVLLFDRSDRVQRVTLNLQREAR